MFCVHCRLLRFVGFPRIMRDQINASKVFFFVSWCCFFVVGLFCAIAREYLCNIWIFVGVPRCWVFRVHQLVTLIFCYLRFRLQGGCWVATLYFGCI